MATYSRLSFTNEEEGKLIAFIEKHPSMWDPKNTDYHNMRMRSELWQNISQQLHKSDGECRRKWRFIRDYYLNKRKRLQAGGEQNHNSKYANLDFLRKVSARRVPIQKTAKEDPMPPWKLETEEISDGEEHSESDNCDNNSGVEISDSKTEATQMESSDLLLDEANMEEHLEDISDSDLDFADLNENEMPISTNAELEDQCVSSMSLPRSATPMLAESTTKAPETEEAMSTQNLVTHEKVIDMFFESMAATVKTFPPHLMATAKMRVFQVINELEVQLHQVDN